MLGEAASQNSSLRGGVEKEDDEGAGKSGSVEGERSPAVKCWSFPRHSVEGEVQEGGGSSLGSGAEKENDEGAGKRESVEGGRSPAVKALEGAVEGERGGGGGMMGPNGSPSLASSYAGA